MRNVVRLLLFALSLASGTAAAFTADEVKTFFGMLDMDADGQVTQDEYNTMKVQVFFIYQSNTLQGIRFEQTRISRQAFDAADADGNGILSGVEILDAVPFTAVAKGKASFDMNDFTSFIKTVER